ncbi:hypothetical protein PF007_g2987 [Phytophthora fragariae]|uniref:Uncharacterized protein n=1 Tax=Phytophthora fragariae TaxID=53985 RepID=A0A6A3TE08_9STRA|nr:hypothetical protein PF007_g2987 [Phytophthora fragariae]
MESSSPGVVQCRKGPDDKPVMQDLRRKVGDIFTESDKMLDLHNKIRKYVPDEFQNDPINAASSVAEEDDAKAAKQARRQHRAAMTKTAKENSDRRAATADEVAQATKKQKTVDTQSAVV